MIILEKMSRKISFSAGNHFRRANFIEEIGDSSMVVCVWSQCSLWDTGVFRVRHVPVVDTGVEVFQRGQPILDITQQIKGYAPASLITPLEHLTTNVSLWKLKVSLESSVLDAVGKVSFPDFLNIEFE